jgi:hypothetical protein
MYRYHITWAVSRIVMYLCTYLLLYRAEPLPVHESEVDRRHIILEDYLPPFALASVLRIARLPVLH